MAKRMKITYKGAQVLARALGFTLKKTSAGDYRINRKGDPEAYAVYESTLQDAVSTIMFIFKKGHF